MGNVSRIYIFLSKYLLESFCSISTTSQRSSPFFCSPAHGPVHRGALAWFLAWPSNEHPPWPQTAAGFGSSTRLHQKYLLINPNPGKGNGEIARLFSAEAQLSPAQVSSLAVGVSTAGFLLLGPHSLGNKAIFCHQPCKVLPDEDRARSATSFSPSCQLFKCSAKSSPKHTALGMSHGTASTAHRLGRMRGRPRSPHPMHVSACKRSFFKAGGPRGPEMGR